MLPPSKTPPSFELGYFNWHITDALPRDKTQSQRLHEPEFRLSTTDPMTGNDVEDATNHPHLMDGNLTVYFETEETRKAYQDMPINHPNEHLPFPASIDDDRGG